MASRSCVSGCGHFLASSDGHDRCLSCLGSTLSQRSWMSHVLIAETWPSRRCAPAASRQTGGYPKKKKKKNLAMPRSSSSGSRRATSAHGQGDLRITVRASPSSASPRASHSSSALHHLVFLDELAALNFQRYRQLDWTEAFWTELSWTMPSLNSIMKCL